MKDKQCGEVMPRKIFAARKLTLRLFPDEQELADLAPLGDAGALGAVNTGGASRSLVKPAEGYSGFLHLQCSRCGRDRSFCTKEKIHAYRCRFCGHQTPLQDLKRLRISCECGGKAGYLTNREEPHFDISCFTCGMPVAVEWRPDRDRYEPMGWREGRKKK